MVRVVPERAATDETPDTAVSESVRAARVAPVDAVLSLQRTYGNRAVTRVLAQSGESARIGSVGDRRLARLVASERRANRANRRFNVAVWFENWDKAVTLLDELDNAPNTNPRSPVWNTDAARVAPTPFYEDTAADDRTAHSTEIYDAPEPLHGAVSGLFADPSTVSVASRAHFATYLVRDMEVLERIDVDVEWLYVSADQPEAAFRVVARGPVTSLAPAHRAVLRAQFPQFDYLP